jgi:WD40 repeat protein
VFQDPSYWSFDSPPVQLAVSGDGSLVAAGCPDHSVPILDVATHTRVAVERGHSDAPRTLRFSGDGRLLASSAGNVIPKPGPFYVVPGELKVWDLDGSRVARNLGTADSSWSCYAFAPDATPVAVAGLKKRPFPAEGQSEPKRPPKKPFKVIRIHEVRGGRLRPVLDFGPGSGVSVIAFSSDGSAVTALHWTEQLAAPASLTTWDVATRLTRASISWPIRSHENGAACSPDRRYFAVPRIDALQLRDTRTNRESLLKYGGGIKWSLEFSRDGRTMAGWQFGARCTLWGVASPSE